VLAAQLARLPNKIAIEGHTDSTMYSVSRTYDNWDLSTNRANEARRLMQAEGIRPDQISQVRGFADRQPRLPDHPEDPSNRRITLIVQYQVFNDSEVPLPAGVTEQNASANTSAPGGAPPAAAQANAGPSLPVRTQADAPSSPAAGRDMRR
jgi:chemotaxis protein MotB